MVEIPPVRDGVRVYNATHRGDLLTNIAAELFIEAIERELQNGYGFVPFIGAGLSVPSGAPQVWEIKSFLDRCIGLALGVEDPGMRAWNPRTDQWPPFVDRERTARDRTASGDWEIRVSAEFEKRRREDRFDVQVPVFHEARGAMAEWRTALLFLSRIVREKRGSGHGEHDVIALDAPDYEVIDSCLREILRGRQPALSHRMLAQLAGVLRLNVVLSTNFDDLLEKAFHEAERPLTVFEVHLSSALPPVSALPYGRHSVVKLHGDRHSMRADYSLDALPSEIDRSRFLEYLLFAKDVQFVTNKNLAHPVQLPFHNHLLVMGSSAADRRTRSFVEHAWKNLDHEFKVYWLCHTQRDVNNVRTFTLDFLIRSGFERGWEGSRVLKHTHLGLLFLQIYQSICRGLPNSGLIFPSISRLAVPPMQSIPEINENLAVKRHVEDLQLGIRGSLLTFQKTGYQSHKLVVVTSPSIVRGATSVCAKLYDEFEEEGINCLWFDMNDISSTDDLFEQLLDAAYYRIGTENWMPVYVAKDPRRRGEEIRRVALSKKGHWIIFLNARETPGANVKAYDEERAKRLPNDWLDEPVEKSNLANIDESRCQERFFELLTELCGPKSDAISVVLLCRSTEAGDTPLIAGLKRHEMIAEPLVLEHSCVDQSEDDTICETLLWTENNEKKRRFLHALCLMQRVRLLATIWSNAVVESDRDTGHHDTGNQILLKWIRDLEKSGLVRRKSGGFIWMDTRVRNRLRKILAEPSARENFCSSYENVRPFLAYWPAEKDEGTIHRELAVWYRHVLSTSKSPAALFEAVYHDCRAAQAKLRSPPSPEAFTFASERFEEAASLLRSHSFLAQTHGYSRGSCRRLEFVRDHLCLETDEVSSRSLELILGTLPNCEKIVNRLQRAITWLRVCCTEVMRAIAREVGEDLRGFWRQRQLRALFLGVPVQQANIERFTSEMLYSCCFGESGVNQVFTANDFRAHDPTLEWIRWWKWNGMLGIASRSYAAARRSLQKGLLSASGVENADKVDSYPFINFAEPSEEQLATQISVISENFRGAKLGVLGRKTSVPERLAIELLRVAEQFVALRLLELSLTRRTDKDGKPVYALKEDAVVPIQNVIRSALALTGQVVSRDHSQDGHYSIPAMLCKCQLLMHQSVCAIHSAKWADATAILGEAESCLNYEDPRRRGTDRAVVALHHVEVCLRHAGSLHVAHKLDGLGHLLTFDAACDEIGRLTHKNSLHWRSAGNRIRNSVFNNLNQPFESNHANTHSPTDGLRRVKALLQDALRFLAQAEQVLFTRRRNVWWTTWFFQRKMQAVSMSVWASVCDIGTPIPFLGLESAPRKTPTMADALLEESQRMIRVDAYRLATVIDAYRSGAIALHVRLMLDSSATRLPDRQQRMHDALARSASQLAIIREARREWAKDLGTPPEGVSGLGPSQKASDDAELDPRLNAYVEGVMERCRLAISLLKDPI